MALKKDRNFDNLIQRFERVVYHSTKGDWRLKLLKEDLKALYDSEPPITLWDAGCGFAQISHWFAGAGHQVTLCDVSKQMLDHAQTQFHNSGVSGEFYHAPAQDLATYLPQFDVVLFHAVLEWLAQPLTTLATVAERVAPGGYLSLMFYNRNAMIYKNTLRGGWRLAQILSDNYLGKGSKLTPPNPQYPHEVLTELHQLGFTVTTHTGIRVFHDYLDQETLAQSDEAELFALEYHYCRLPTFRDMGRYVHVLAQRNL